VHIFLNQSSIMDHIRPNLRPGPINLPCAHISISVLIYDVESKVSNFWSDRIK